MLADQDDRVIVVLGGHPRGKTWHQVHAGAYAKMKEVALGYGLGEKEKNHARGKFDVINVGYGIPMGGKVSVTFFMPHVLCPNALQVPSNRRVHPASNIQRVESLLSDASIASISGHANSKSTFGPWRALYSGSNACTGLFATWAPNLHRCYLENAAAVFDKAPYLRRNYSNSVWASSSFNFGPRTVCRLHRDSKNLPHGLCAVTALGTYDHQREGHLVLSDIKLYIQLPPGSTILIPSAALAHGNTPVGVGQERMSITQYTPAGLFRWVECGFKTVDEYNSALDSAAAKNPAVKEEEAKRVQERLQRGPEYFSTLDELRTLFNAH